MPRPLRLDHPGAHFHITARGVNRGTIFIDDADRLCFLKILSSACRRYGGVGQAYCLMGNHYHLLLQSLHGRISSVMQHLNGSYAQWFNRRRDRSGHLFQGRYKASLVDRDSYLLEAVRYIELNPCRADLVADPGEWEWSSFSARLGFVPPPEFLDLDSVLEHFGSAGQALDRYRVFITGGLQEAKGQSTIDASAGSPTFLRHQATRAREQRSSQDVPKYQCILDRPDLASLLEAADGPVRRNRASIAFHRYGYTMAQIAKHLRVHYTTVSRWIRQTECDNAWSDP